MELTAEQFEDLVGAYALDACEPEEADAVERYAAANRAAAIEVERLREAAAGLGAAGALAPPPGLRDRVLAQTAPRVEPASAVAALRAETERFDAFLSTLGRADLGVTTHNGLDAQELVGHIEAVDRAFVAAADDPSVAYIGPNEIASITEAALPRVHRESFAQTHERFRETRKKLVAVGVRVPAGRRVAGYSRDDTLLIRAFETWTHHDDLRRALGRTEQVPAPTVLRAMAELAMSSLPLAASARGVAAPGRSVRIRLVGPGGGDWTVPCAPGEAPATAPDAVITASVLDWCRRVGDRIAPDELQYSVDGDAQLAADLLGAASAFAAI
jgi:uncharacterized protein (TIGR03083 family)